MPVSFKFTDNKNPERKVMLAEIDELCCKEFGIPVSDTLNSRIYEDLTNFGIFNLCWETSIAKPEKFDAELEKLRNERGGKLPEKLELQMAFYRKMLVEDFTFHAWRGM